MSYPYIPAKSISYGGSRALKNILYIVIHNTGNTGDTAAGNVHYFSAAGSNTRAAGAHFFVDQSGSVYQSIKMDYSAWAVGGFFTSANGAASLYGKCTNFNSVSIELCDIVSKNPSQKMIAATRDLIKFIQKQCPNAKTICRHWDVNGKDCPLRMIGQNNALWNSFKNAISHNPAPTRKAITYGYTKQSLNVYKNKPNWVNTGKDIKKDSLVYCYASYNEKKNHSDGLPIWVWWAINPECTEWVVYTNRINKEKVFAEGILTSGLTSYKTPNGSSTGNFYPAGTNVRCYATQTDKIKHADGRDSWVWWRITPLLDDPQWLVYSGRIKKE